MAGAVRKNDNTSGHGAYGNQVITSGSSNVYINGKSAVTVGDFVSEHCAYEGENYVCHDGFISSGSNNVFVNGKAKVRIGDNVSCGGVTSNGSSNVKVN